MGTELGAAPPYQGPQDVVFTSVEEASRNQGAEAGSYQPAGTASVVVEPGDTLSGLLAQARPPLDWNDPAQRAQFLKDNPQFATPQDLAGAPELAELAGGRNPDLIWPGEVVYVRDPALAAAEALQDAHGLSVGTDSQATHQAEQVAQAEADLEIAVRDELAAGGTPEAIKARLQAGSGLPDAQIDAVVERATVPPSPTNPAGGSRAGAPFSPEYATNQAAAAWAQADGLGVSTDSQVTHRMQELERTGNDFVAAVQEELRDGASADDIKARYGNDPDLDALIDRAAAGG